MTKEPFIRLFHYLLIVLTILFVFYKVTGFDFILFDDNLLIIKSYGFIRDISNIPNAFLQDANITSGVYSNYYRPVQVLTLIINAQFCHQNAGCYHVFNLIIHILFSVTLFKFLQKYHINKWLSLLLTLLFSVHPANASVVAWIPGGMEALLGIFFLYSYMFFGDWVKKPNAILLSLHVLFFNLALYTKETAILMIPLLLVQFWNHIRSKRFLQNKLILVGWFVSVGIWFALRSIAVKNFSISVFDQFSIANIVGYIIYIGKLIPVSLSVFPIARDSTLFPGFIIIAAALAVYAVYLRGKGEYSFGFNWFVVLLLPSISQPELLKDPLFLDHRIYLPFVGLLMVAGLFLSKIPSVKYILLFGISSLIILIFSFQSVKRIDYYRNAEAFWTQAVKDSPHSAVSHTSLGYVYQFIRNNPKGAEIYYKKALDLDASVLFARTNLGILYFENGDYVRANREMVEELRYNNNDYTWLHLGRLYYSQNMWEKASESWEEAYALSPNNTPVVINLALVNADLKKFPEAKKYYEKAVALGGYDGPDKDWLAKVKFLENY